MKSEKEFLEAINEKQQYYHENRLSMTVKESEDISDDIKKLREKLSDFLSKGAVEHAKCGTKPVGMSRVNNSGKYYEVGCPVCPPEETPVEGGVKRVNYSSRGFSPKEAVNNWNDAFYFEDFQPREENASE